ncbi:hypothetical protein [Streptomyces sp. NPDC101455]|uniref:hypothetical protein n=1 Tax=Streptomyces sp. NPDC101455 TaxID=3366142 RepID=UPI003800D9EE
MERKTRKPTSAELHAARAMGCEVPEEVEVETRSSAELHAARVTAPRKTAVPAGMQTSEYIAQRLRAMYAPGADEEQPDEDDEEPQPAPAGVRVRNGWAIRADGGMTLLTGEEPPAA